MKKVCFIVACSSALALTGAPAWAQPQVGEDAPGIDVGEWFNLPGGMSAVKAKDLKGQIVMVEFWATW